MLRAAAQDEAPPVPNQIQDQGQPMQPLQAAPVQNASGVPVTLHGVVRNAATGEGIARALVQIEGDAQTGALTDGDGRFEIPGLRAGPVEVSVFKPGFFDPTSQMDSGPPRRGEPGPPQNVIVAAETPDVEFTLAPTCTIRGRIDLSTGEPAEGIEVALERRVVQDGRAAWQQSEYAKTRSDGTYRFGGLADGQYEVYTMPALDSQPAVTLLAPGKASATEQWGYASEAYPGTRDYAGAQVISVAHGADAQANFLLTQEPFEAVTAEVTLPGGIAGKGPQDPSAQVMDGAGQLLPYNAQYDASTHTVQAALPAGSYSLLVSRPSFQGVTFSLDGGPQNGSAQIGALEGSVDFAVADHAVTGLRVPLATPAFAPIDVTVNRSGVTVNRSGSGIPAAQSGQVAVMVSPAKEPLSGAMVSQYASGSAEGALDANYVPPGAYWVHTYIDRGLCEQSFTAGGANLAREPLVVGPAGTTAPIELTLRDDCAQLTLELPENLAGPAAGVEPFYTVYVVPDFDFTSDVRPAVLRPSVSTSFTVNDLTPGNYHVYTLAGDAHLEYRNPAVLASLAGQAVTLAAGATETLVVEGPQP
jgi:hypothetical protein